MPTTLLLAPRSFRNSYGSVREWWQRTTLAYCQPSCGVLLSILIKILLLFPKNKNLELLYIKYQTPNNLHIEYTGLGCFF